MLTIDRLTEACVDRSIEGYGLKLQDWTILEWAGAMAGEAGEAANAAKKIRRVEMKLNVGGHKDWELLVADLGEELADTVIYAVLTARKQGIDLTAAICDKFNKVSIENGWPHRI